MTLEFPNRSRNFDEARKAVRFIGYDGMFEIRFFVEAAALASASPGRSGVESDCLAAFDALRPSIHDAARSAYDRKRGDSYVLTAADLR